MTYFERFYFLIKPMGEKEWELSRMYLTEDQAKDGIVMLKLASPYDECTKVQSIKFMAPQPKKRKAMKK